MKRDELKAILGENATEEVVKAIMDLNGKDAESHKTVKADLEKANGTIEELNKTIKELQEKGANADEWKSKFEALDTQIKEEKAKAETERAAKEKADNIAKRFSAVDINGEGKANKWVNEPTKAYYLNKFTEALESKDNEGKSDTDIFNALVKDDATAFVTVQTQVLKGGELGGNNHKSSQLNEKRLI